MLLSTIVKTIKRDSHRGNQAVTTDLITTDIIACINRAMRDVQLLVPKRFFHKEGNFALSAAVGVYSLAADVQEPILFYYSLNGSVTKLQKINSDAEWLNVYDPNAPLGKPRYYREVGPASATGYKQIQLAPTEDGTSIIVMYEYYKVKGSDLTAADLASEVTQIPDYVQSVLEKGALYYFLKGFDDGAQMIAKKDYEEAKLALEMADEQDKDSSVAFRFGMLSNDMYTQGFKLP